MLTPDEHELLFDASVSYQPFDFSLQQRIYRVQTQEDGYRYVSNIQSVCVLRHADAVGRLVSYLVNRYCFLAAVMARERRNDTSTACRYLCRLIDALSQHVDDIERAGGVMPARATPEAWARFVAVEFHTGMPCEANMDPVATSCIVHNFYTLFCSSKAKESGAEERDPVCMLLRKTLTQTNKQEHYVSKAFKSLVSTVAPAALLPRLMEWYCMSLLGAYSGPEGQRRPLLNWSRRREICVAWRARTRIQCKTPELTKAVSKRQLALGVTGILQLWNGTEIDLASARDVLDFLRLRPSCMAAVVLEFIVTTAAHRVHPIGQRLAPHGWTEFAQQLVRSESGYYSTSLAGGFNTEANTHPAMAMLSANRSCVKTFASFFYAVADSVTGSASSPSTSASTSSKKKAAPPKPPVPTAPRAVIEAFAEHILPYGHALTIARGSLLRLGLAWESVLSRPPQFREMAQHALAIVHLMCQVLKLDRDARRTAYEVVCAHYSISSRKTSSGKGTGSTGTAAAGHVFRRLPPVLQRFIVDVYRAAFTVWTLPVFSQMIEYQRVNLKARRDLGIFYFCPVCRQIWSFYTGFRLRVSGHDIIHRAGGVAGWEGTCSLVTGERYCGRKSGKKHAQCRVQKVCEYSLFGRILFYGNRLGHVNDRAYFLCPQPDCGMEAQYVPSKLFHNSYGPACLGCTMDIAGETPPVPVSGRKRAGAGLGSALATHRRTATTGGPGDRKTYDVMSRIAGLSHMSASASTQAPMEIVDGPGESDSDEFMDDDDDGDDNDSIE